MRIQNTSPIYNQNYISQRTSNPNQTQTAFKSAPCVQQAMKKFIPEAGFFVFNTPNITPQVLENFLKRFYPPIKLEIMDPNLPLYMRKSKAQTEALVGFDDTGFPKVYEMTMRVGLDDLDTFKGKVEFLDSLVHEMTHVYQNDPSNYESPNWIARKRFLENAHSIDMIHKIGQTSNDTIKVWRNVEREMLETPTIALNISQFLPKPVPCLDSLLLESTYFRRHGKYGEEYLKKLLKENYKTHNIYDEVLANLTIKEIAKNEAEAYRNGNVAAKDVLGIKGSTDRDYIPMVFDIISNAIL